MIPAFDPNGNLPRGIYPCSWEELEERFSWNFYRKRLIRGMKPALRSLKGAGCSTAFIDGSFVTKERRPKDYDACWDPNGVDISRLDPILAQPRRSKQQKAKFYGEWYPFNAQARPGITFLEFFQEDRYGNSKGIIRIDLGDYDDKE